MLRRQRKYVGWPHACSPMPLLTLSALPPLLLWRRNGGRGEGGRGREGERGREEGTQGGREGDREREREGGREEGRI